MKKLLLILFSSILLMLSACDEAPASSRQVEAAAQERQSSAAIATVGMPAINNFQEKRMMKMVLELRDTALATVTYTQDMNGNLHKLCDSIGYGLPYATQFTNPQKVIGSDYEGHPMATIAQADPNGLYSPASADGTWVMCVNPTTKKATPMYVEPHIIVSTYELPSK